MTTLTLHASKYKVRNSTEGTFSGEKSLICWRFAHPWCLLHHDAAD